MKLAWDVARRYLAPRRGGRFLSFITWISLGGVTVGVTALIVVIAVMSGATGGLPGQDPGREPPRPGLGVLQLAQNGRLAEGPGHV